MANHRLPVPVWKPRRHAGVPDRGGAQVDLRGGSYELPFGRLDVAFDENQLVWATCG
jgi:hypothetical protein